MGFLETSDLQVLGTVLDFVGFAPSRFYLRETCKKLNKSIPAKVYVTPREFATALRKELINPEHLFLSPNYKVDASAVSSILGSCSDLMHESPRLGMKLLERTLIEWDSALVAESQATYYLQNIEWEAWMAGHNRILEKVIDCIALVKSPYKSGRSFGFFARCTPGTVVMNLEFCQRLINEWHRPRDEGEWRGLIGIAISEDLPRSAIDYFIAESGLDWTGDPYLMHSLVQSNHVDLLEQYLNSLTGDDEPNESAKMNAIITAVGDQKEQMVRYLVERFGLKADNGICSHLTYRESTHAISILDFLIAHGADINSSNGSTGTCLEMALSNGRWALADALIERGANLDSIYSVLVGPVGKDVTLFRRYVIEKGIVDGLIDEELMVQTISSLCSVEIIEQVFDLVYAVDPSVVTVAFNETMRWSRESPKIPDYVPFIQRLISIDPSLVHNVVDSVFLPIGVCALYKPAELVAWTREESRFERNFGEFFGSESRSGYEADYRSDYGSDYESDQSDKLTEEWFQTTPDTKRVEAMNTLKNTLIRYGANPTIWFASDCLVKATRSEAKIPVTAENVRKLLSGGVRIDEVVDGRTALSHCASLNDMDKAKMLLELGASIFKEDGSIPSAFIRAASVRTDISLLSHFYGLAQAYAGFDINALDKFTPVQTGAIHEAATSNSIQGIKFLLEKGADPNLRSGSLGMTPLHTALTSVNKSSLAIARMLIDAKADVNARENNGRTALFTCVLTGSLFGVDFLLANGADPHIPDDEGIRPIDLAHFICRFQKPLIEAGLKYKFRVCVRPTVNHESAEYSFPGKQILIRDRVADVVNEPEARPLAIADIEFARKFRLDTIFAFIKTRKH